jgi:hypothetical protein
MARSRNLKPDFFTNEILAEIDPLGRLLFEGLWCIADREGRLEDRPKKIKAEVLPYDNCDIDFLLQELAKRNFIIRYVVNGGKYIWLPTFKKHQNPHPKEAKSIIPEFKNESCNFPEKQLTSNEISETSRAGSSGSSGSSDSLPPLPTDGESEKTVAEVLSDNEKVQRLDRLRMKLFAKMFPTNNELEAMEQMVKLAPIDTIEVIIKEAHAKFKPKYPGDKIKTINYFLPFVQNAAALINSRAAPKNEPEKPILEQTQESIELTKEILDALPEWMRKEAASNG